jgi:4a-hydroxytetrahydrobiopterin dehydratase
MEGLSTALTADYALEQEKVKTGLPMNRPAKETSEKENSRDDPSNDGRFAAYVDQAREKLTEKIRVIGEDAPDALTRTQLLEYLDRVPDWVVTSDRMMDRTFVFEEFAETISFVSKIGTIAETEQHFPDILIHGGTKVKVYLWTRAVNRLSQKDFTIAEKIDRAWAVSRQPGGG